MNKIKQERKNAQSGTSSTSSTGARTPWKSRIIGQGEEPPDQLLAHPNNWRVHPRDQQEALEGVLAEVGWVQQVIVNRRTGHLVDGHLRVMLALRRDEPFVPVLYVDITEAEESLVLATLDPLAALAGTDAQKLGELLEGIKAEDEAVQKLLADLAQSAGIMPPDVEFPEFDESAENEVKHCECPQCGYRWPK